MDGVKVLIKHTLPCSDSPLAACACLYLNVLLRHHPKDDAQMRMHLSTDNPCRTWKHFPLV
jgi:hypothetical protein